MGSICTLSVDKLEIDWGKNNFISNHSALFQKEDLKLIPYYYEGNNIERKKGYSKKLISIKHRLNLLGYSMKEVEASFNSNLLYFNQLYETSLPITFEQFYRIIRNVNIKKIDMTKDDYIRDYAHQEFVEYCVLNEIEDFKMLSSGSSHQISHLLESLDPYIILRILAENEKNYDLYVNWRTADVIENGWILEEDIIPNLSEKDKILIVTEGSTDTSVIKRSIDLLYGDVSDFFSFIDMGRNYPFTGTGNLKNFIQGLSKINILNKIIVILDNDVAGNSVFNSVKSLNLPPNLKVMTLPHNKDFEKFKCIGPHGISYEDINGRAVSIECFLDHSFSRQDVYVRWTSYDKNMNEYQGNIEPKNRLIKSFHQNYNKNYDFSKIKYLIDYMLDVWDS